jgi:hypothetical protein
MSAECAAVELDRYERGAILEALADKGVRTFFWTYFGSQYPSGIAATLSFNTLRIPG